MKRLFLTILILFMAGLGYAQDIYPSKVNYAKTKYPAENPKIIDGAIFEKGLTVMDCHNMTFINCEIAKELELNSSYPADYGLKNIRFEKCYIHDAVTDRLIMLGGSVVEGIKFIDCTILRCCGGTHLVYKSGGHWKAEYPPLKDIVFRGCTLGFAPAGRHVVQFNGRFDGVKIIGCTIYHGQLCGISLIGVQNAVIKNNVIYGNNRGGIVLFDYASHWKDYYNNFTTQEDIDAFCATHWPNKNIEICNNTIVQGPHQFSKDPWHGDDPTDHHAPITVENAVHSGFEITVNGEKKFIQFDFPNENINIHHNIIVLPSVTNKSLLDIKHVHEASITKFDNNMCYWPYNDAAGISFYDKLASCSWNWKQNPEFASAPKYGLVLWNGSLKEPDYDWTQFTTEFDAYSRPGYNHKVGKLFKVAIAEK